MNIEAAFIVHDGPPYAYGLVIFSLERKGEILEWQANRGRWGAQLSDLLQWGDTLILKPKIFEWDDFCGNFVRSYIEEDFRQAKTFREIFEELNENKSLHIA